MKRNLQKTAKSTNNKLLLKKQFQYNQITQNIQSINKVIGCKTITFEQFCKECNITDFCEYRDKEDQEIIESFIHLV